MRVLLLMAAALSLVLTPVFAQEPVPEAALCTADNPNACDVGKPELKQARRAFNQGMKLKERRPEEAFHFFEEAARLVPRNTDYVTARELQRQQIAFRSIQQGNALAMQGHAAEAMAEYQKVLAVDPANQFAADRVRELTPAPPPPSKFVETSPELATTAVNPKPVRLNFNQTTDAPAALMATIGAYGLRPTLDPSVPRRRVHFEVSQVDFYQAMQTLCALTGTFWVATSPTSITVAADTPAAHRLLDRWVMRTFYLPEVNTPQDLTDITNLLRTLLDLRFVTQQPATSSITVRGPAPAVEAATRLLESMEAGRPQVLLEFQAFQVSRQLMRNMGAALPLQFNIFNIPAGALAGLAGGSIQSLINQLISSGGINQGNTSALSALLAQLQSQQNSLFANPVATFGGGTTLMGIGVPPATANFSLTDSHITILDHISVRAAQGNATTFTIGERYPILTSIYAPVYNTPQISSVIGSNSYVAPFPSFNYEDLGITVKAKPMIHGTTDVTLELEMTIRALTAQNYNGIPVVSQQSYKGVITAPNEESVAMAGNLSVSEQKSFQGIPGVSSLPPGDVLTGDQNKQQEEDELLIVITPHILRSAATTSTPTILVPVAER